MNRKSKNIIMILLLSILIGVSIIIMKDLRNPEHPEMMQNSINQIENKVEDKTETATKETTTETTEKDETENQDVNVVVIQRRGMDRMRHPGMEMQKPEKTHRDNRNLFLAIGVLTSALIMYLIMSGFNKKTMKETLSGIDNIIIFILATAIITFGLTVVQTSLTKSNQPDMIRPPMQTIKNTD